MRRFTLLILLALPLLLAADWPQRGDTVYLSVALPAFTVGTLAGIDTPADLKALDPCAPLRVGKVAAEWSILGDDSGTARRLFGNWTVRIHRTADECRELATKEPSRARIVVKKGVGYELAAAAH